MADDRKLLSHKKERLKDYRIREIISSKLREEWTPEQIAGHINLNHPELHTNHESIYLYIYNDAREFIPKLVRNHNKRHNRQHKQDKRVSRIPNRTMITDRPEVINQKERYSDWEADTVVSRQSKASLVVIRERKSQFVKIRKINSRTARNTRVAIVSMLKHIPDKLRKSITSEVRRTS